MNSMLKSTAAAMLTGWMAFAAAQETFSVPPELWDRPRSGRIVLEQPAVKQAVGILLSRPGSRLVIHHAAGQEPLLQAEELRAWLIALAVGAERIGLGGDLKSGEPLKIEIMK
ncbi:MAG: hypothetical protein ACK4N4_05640 [Burkholderiales bacterium]